MKIAQMVIGLILFLTATTIYAAEDSDDPYHLKGMYDMKITIGDKVFDDILHFDSVSEDHFCHTDSGVFCGDIEGKLIVPGVFEAVLEVGTYYVDYSKLSGQLEFQFYILAQENGKQFYVHYSGVQDNENTLIGEARLADESLLGTFTAHKREEKP
ncbi:MAG: hypothetical protein HYS98_04985 [Deltaproteobacteria bacterium]|nr:hypothetical protein [Deltaproteobacteria bacterium]